MKRGKEKVSLEGDERMLVHNPFDEIAKVSEAPPSGAPPKPSSDSPDKQPVKGTRVELRRLRAGRAGKTVIGVSGLPSREVALKLADELKRALGRGGALTEDGFEVQGDCLEQVADFLVAAGYRPIKTGG